MAEFVAVKDYALSLWSRAFELKLAHRSVLKKTKVNLCWSKTPVYMNN